MRSGRCLRVTRGLGALLGLWALAGCGDEEAGGVCEPEARSCSGSRDVLRCNAEGTDRVLLKTCGDSEVCRRGLRR